MAGHMSHIKEPSIWPCLSRVSHSSVVRASNRYISGRSWVRLPSAAQKIVFLSISTWERIFTIYTLSKSPVHLSLKHLVRVNLGHVFLVTACAGLSYKMRSNDWGYSIFLFILRDTLTLCEYAMMFGTAVEETVKRVSFSVDSSVLHIRVHIQIHITNCQHPMFACLASGDHQNRANWNEVVG